MPGDDNIQSEGRRENAAQPLDAADNKGGPERYPAVRQDDSVEGEPRTFEGGNPAPRQGAGDTTAVPPSANEGRLGPGADPVEGKR
ncbi:hypothetical protein ACO2Q0_09390 [Phenylobacterium sp. VNQ135]|uniref:hypothetical protein n=1 Tax=Phenylobacterium sp. VNQ135 TaxID=3400922 RepID=UPI003C0238C4